jgi:hypothetical protein
MNLSNVIANAVNGAAALPSLVCQYCNTALTINEVQMHMECSTPADEIMCDACAEGTNPTPPAQPVDTSAAEALLAQLKAENAALLAARKPAPETPKTSPANDLAAQLAALQAENAAIQARQAEKAKIQASKVDAPKSKVAGTYPEGATIQDRVLLDAIHACKDAKVLKGHTVPPCWGGALYAYLHTGLSAKYPAAKKADGKPDWSAADARIKPAIESACQRGIITRVFGSTSVMYFDGREVKPKASYASSRGPAAAAVTAIEAAF